MAAPEIKRYTAEEFLAMEDLPVCCELIHGEIVPTQGGTIDMSAAPNTHHQEISGEIYVTIKNYIRKNKGKCKVFSAPTDVKIRGDEMVQPDIFVVCDRDKIKGQYCEGAPDWVIEVTSPSTAVKDFSSKLELYKESGVREYWIVDTEGKRVIVYPFEENKNVEIYTFKEAITSHIYKNAEEPLTVDLSEIEDQFSE